MQVTYIEAIRQAMEEEMARDPNVMLLGEDGGVMGGAFKASAGLLAKFGPERVVDMPISESMIVGGGVGLALQGMRPVCEMQFIDFISCAFDQIVNNAGDPPLPARGAASLPDQSSAPQTAAASTGGCTIRRTRRPGSSTSRG
jgi:pyruvate/2-oxoglutarate/acetoin dehydrogenase E1 component